MCSYGTVKGDVPCRTGSGGGGEARIVTVKAPGAWLALLRASTPRPVPPGAQRTGYRGDGAYGENTGH